MAKKGLGAGLGALLGEEAADLTPRDGVSVLPVMKIEPRQDQPRTVFDPAALEDLAASIRAHGLIQPITVRATGGGWYQIIAGERRWRAAKLAGLEDVPVRILDADDRESAELALVENLQREDLNPAEEARGYRALMNEYGLTQEAVAERVGKSRPVVANALRLLSLPDGVLAYLERGELSLSQARAILELPDDADRTSVAAAAVENGLTVREIAALVKGRTAKKRRSRAAADGVDYYAEVERQLAAALGRRVSIAGGRKKGRITIEYYGAEDFETIRKALVKADIGNGKKQS